MTEKEYRSNPAISRSELWKLYDRNGGTPEKFLWEKSHPKQPTKEMLFGQVAHKLLLQPEDFDTEFAVSPNVDGRTREGKAAIAEFNATLGDRAAIDADSYAKAVSMVEAAKAFPFFNLLFSGEHETPIFWIDPDTNEPCKCRLDTNGVADGRPFIADYKTCSNASNDAFRKSAVDHGYYLQAAMYLEGFCQHNYGKSVLTMINDDACPPFIFFAQEKDEPFCCNILIADNESILKGYDIYRELIGKYHYCKESGNWYGYLGRDNILNTLDLPAWMKSGS